MFMRKANPIEAVTKHNTAQSKNVLVKLPFEKAIPCLVALVNVFPLLCV